MSAPIPSTIDEVSPEWLTEATGRPTATATATQIGVGIGVSSALYRVATDDGSVVVKLPAIDEAAVFTSSVLRMYIRECRFFTELASEAPVRVPACHLSAVDEETSRFVLVMEDLGGMRLVDQVEGMAIADAERAVDELAAWHAQWWGRGDDLAARGLTVSLADPIYPAILPMVWGEGWDKVTSSMDVPEPIRRVGPRWPDVFARLLTELAAGPNTMTHGDYRADNILFAPDGSVALLDFQLIGTGSAAYDLAYFVTQSVEP
ncbi:MAG TPA: phosphotransferase, partial [Acidimicrobiales bacterium]|nr:phosphotransferase [Acidimicrobiales bacterium]